MYIIYIYIQVANHWDIERCFLKDYFSLDRYTTHRACTEKLASSQSKCLTQLGPVGDGTTNRSLLNSWNPPPGLVLIISELET